MGYRLVIVSPLKPFPIASFGIANMANLEDAKKQISAAAKNVAAAEILALDAGVPLKRDYEIRAAHEKRAEAEIIRLEERWPKIEPALKMHLARQERRLVHFKASCRVSGCTNLHRQARVGTAVCATKAHRPAARPLFCRLHVGVRRWLTKDALDALHASSAKRVAII